MTHLKISPHSSEMYPTLRVAITGRLSSIYISFFELCMFILYIYIICMFHVYMSFRYYALEKCKSSICGMVNL
jgi:uncharacterized protein YqhQ